MDARLAAEELPRAWLRKNPEELEELAPLVVEVAARAAARDPERLAHVAPSLQVDGNGRTRDKIVERVEEIV